MAVEISVGETSPPGTTTRWRSQTWMTEPPGMGPYRAHGPGRRCARPGAIPMRLRGERRDLNPRPPGPQPGALPTELRPPRGEQSSGRGPAEPIGASGGDALAATRSSRSRTSTVIATASRHWCKTCKSEVAAEHYQANKSTKVRGEPAQTGSVSCVVHEPERGQALRRLRADIPSRRDALGSPTGIREGWSRCGSLVRHGSRELVLREVAKCELVCANCPCRAHRATGTRPRLHPEGPHAFRRAILFGTRPRSSAG